MATTYPRHHRHPCHRQRRLRPAQNHPSGLPGPPARRRAGHQDRLSRREDRQVGDGRWRPGAEEQ